MIAVSVICLPVFLTGANISRAEGAVFLLYYLAYMVYLVLHATDHALYDEFGTLVVAVVLPLTLAVGGALAVKGWRDERGKARPGPDSPGGRPGPDGSTAVPEDDPAEATGR
jgi:cation:H+ antiporter